MKYICYYDINDRESRKYVLSAKNKIDYILSALEGKVNESIEIVSMSTTLSRHYQSGKLERLSQGVTLKLFPSFGRRNAATRLLDYILFPLYLFIYLLFNTRKNEKVIVYHSPYGYAPIEMAKKIKKFKVILELEEIYADVAGKEKRRNSELRFAQLADGYIFPTELLNGEINKSGKPTVIIHGTYQVEPQRECKNAEEKMQSGGNKMIHCVYAGTFDPRKGGAAAAAAAAEFLPEGYHIHILGFGSENEKKIMRDAICEIAKKSKAKVTYDGLLTGEDYIRFIQSCDIGLSTQNPDAAFNATSFPSKILSYMANGLRVVSIRIPVVEQSAVGDMLYYYDKQTPEEIAKAILSVNMQDEYDSRGIIRKLDKEFQNNLATLLEIK